MGRGRGQSAAAGGAPTRANADPEQRRILGARLAAAVARQPRFGELSDRLTRLGGGAVVACYEEQLYELLERASLRDLPVTLHRMDD
jgi:hypothetical protein